MGNWALHVILLVIMFSGGDFLFAENIFSDSHWISVEKKDDKSNQWLCFKKNFTCGIIKSPVYMNLAVDSKYWLWINDSLVVFEGGLKRGPNPDDTYIPE